MSHPQIVVKNRIDRLVATLERINNSFLPSHLEICIDIIVEAIKNGNKIL